MLIVYLSAPSHLQTGNEDVTEHDKGIPMIFLQAFQHSLKTDHNSAETNLQRDRIQTPNVFM